MLENKLIEQWKSLYLRLGGRENEAEVVIMPLMSLYSPKHRPYHNLDHISISIDELHKVKHLSDNPDEIEFAIWMHDAIYNPKLEDNEEKSADLAQIIANAIGLPKEKGKRIYTLVMATKHNNYESTNDGKLIADIDMIILGVTKSEFDKYSREIEQEYSFVDKLTYTKHRIKFVKNMLAKDRIYQTDYFRNKYEQQARQNLTEHLRELEKDIRNFNCNIFAIYGLDTVT